MQDEKQAPPKETASSDSSEKQDKKMEGIRSMDLLLDVPLQVSVELGRTRMLINDLLQLSRGSVVELSKMAGEPLEVLVNNKPIARGEVVMVNEKFGIRIIEIISPMERVEQLG